MSTGLEAVLQTVGAVCPDDGASLSRSANSLVCEICKRRFPIHGGRVLDLLPRVPSGQSFVNASYRDFYLATFDEPMTLEDTPAPWADPTRIGEDGIRKKLNHVDWILKQLETHSRVDELLLCDVSGGPGYYTIGLAPHFKYVLHCDLSGRAISHVLHRAADAHLENIYFCRLDYFALPFIGTLDRVLCLDTLIRGLDHDKVLLLNIARAIGPNGCALVDFHNWWHNPARRLGLLPDNFVGNHSYSRNELTSLLRELDLKTAITPFYAEATGAGIVSRAARVVLPCTRYTVRIKGRREVSGPTRESTPRVSS